jgi:hypothetical protein
MNPDTTEPIEIYTPARIAEFLLGNATSPEEYADAVAEVRRMGLDPDQIEHFRPTHVDAND